MHEQQRAGTTVFSNVATCLLNDIHSACKQPSLVSFHPDGTDIIVGVTDSRCFTSVCTYLFLLEGNVSVHYFLALS